MEIEGKPKLTPQIVLITKIPTEYRGDVMAFKFLLIKSASESLRQDGRKLELDIAGGGVQIWSYMSGFTIMTETIQICKALTDLLYRLKDLPG